MDGHIHFICPPQIRDVCSGCRHAKDMLPVQGWRGIGRADMIHNAAMPHIEVIAKTCEVRADGNLLTCEPARELRRAQRCFL